MQMSCTSAVDAPTASEYTACTATMSSQIVQEEAVQYVATTVDRLLKEQQQQGLKRVYVISTYVIGKERLLVAIHKLTGCRIGVTQQKMDTMKCLELAGTAHTYGFHTPALRTNLLCQWRLLHSHCKHQWIRILPGGLHDDTRCYGCLVHSW